MSNEKPMVWLASKDLFGDNLAVPLVKAEGIRITKTPTASQGLSNSTPRIVAHENKESHKVTLTFDPSQARLQKRMNILSAWSNRVCHFDAKGSNEAQEVFDPLLRRLRRNLQVGFSLDTSKDSNVNIKVFELAACFPIGWTVTNTSPESKTYLAFHFIVETITKGDDRSSFPSCVNETQNKLSPCALGPLSADFRLSASDKTRVQVDHTQEISSSIETDSILSRPLRSGSRSIFDAPSRNVTYVSSHVRQGQMRMTIPMSEPNKEVLNKVIGLSRSGDSVPELSIRVEDGDRDNCYPLFVSFRDCAITLFEFTEVDQHDGCSALIEFAYNRAVLYLSDLEGLAFSDKNESSDQNLISNSSLSLRAVKPYQNVSANNDAARTLKECRFLEINPHFLSGVPTIQSSSGPSELGNEPSETDSGRLFIPKNLMEDDEDHFFGEIEDSPSEEVPRFARRSEILRLSFCQFLGPDDGVFDSRSSVGDLDLFRILSANLYCRRRIASTHLLECGDWDVILCGEKTNETPTGAESKPVVTEILSDLDSSGEFDSKVSDSSFKGKFGWLSENKGGWAKSGVFGELEEPDSTYFHPDLVCVPIASFENSSGRSNWLVGQLQNISVEVKQFSPAGTPLVMACTLELRSIPSYDYSLLRKDS